MQEGVVTTFSNVQLDEKTQHEECLDNGKDALLSSELERPPLRRIGKYYCEPKCPCC